MLEELKDKLICELKDVSKDGVKTGNIEYIATLSEAYKNLNKADKEEAETMIYDDRIRENYGRSYREYGDEYDNSYGRYGARGRGPYAKRDRSGRYADAMMPLEDRYSDYMDYKRRYRSNGDSKEDMHKGLEMVMKYMVKLVDDLYNDCDSEEERRIMDKYLRKLSEIQ